MTVVYFWDLGNVQVPSRTTADVVIMKLVEKYGRGRFFVVGDEDMYEDTVSQLKKFQDVTFYGTTGKQRAEELLIYEMNRKRLYCKTLQTVVLLSGEYRFASPIFRMPNQVTTAVIHRAGHINDILRKAVDETETIENLCDLHTITVKPSKSRWYTCKIL
uniref:NYN domain-containing protein n=1 Tax=Plectus sambesii TaxID=2011161 RepID=A0A914WFM5_9BILA